MLTFSSFLYFCRAHGRTGIEEEKVAGRDEGESDSDDALPPPIRTRRAGSAEAASAISPLAGLQAPEVDELGVPLSELPKEPITNFSWRAFFTSINVLRIKIGRAHV